MDELREEAVKHLLLLLGKPWDRHPTLPYTVERPSGRVRLEMDVPAVRIQFRDPYSATGHDWVTVVVTQWTYGAIALLANQIALVVDLAAQRWDGV